ncbi:alternate-type signal peptide domain-containing protein [Paenarthrobacter sp. NPDC092416]|uniref:alternate-type signal peptide domain-containing protein n=1 Tax=Paenarthrobacter sp. NPDC092416 TaxID=3364386 RepID=UPI00381E65BE
MKNKTMLKGAAAIALGGALLLGGGGTLAWWNAADSAAAGTIVAGDLNVEAAAGVWTDRAGSTIDISTYRVVPGDLLTYTQDLDVTLEGDKMAANLVAERTGAADGFDPASVTVSAPTLTVGGEAIENPLTTSQHVTASITFEFKSGTTARTDVGSSVDLGTVAFTLQQIQQPGLQ